jgi:hypothetical protein
MNIFNLRDEVINHFARLDEGHIFAKRTEQVIYVL